MPVDTQRVHEDGDMRKTPLRNFPCSDELWKAAKATAAEQGEKVSPVIVRALYAYVADPQAFNSAVANIRGGKS